MSSTTGSSHGSSGVQVAGTGGSASGGSAPTPFTNAGPNPSDKVLAKISSVCSPRGFSLSLSFCFSAAPTRIAQVLLGPELFGSEGMIHLAAEVQRADAAQQRLSRRRWEHRGAAAAVPKRLRRRRHLT